MHRHSESTTKLCTAHICKLAVSCSCLMRVGQRPTGLARRCTMSNAPAETCPQSMRLRGGAACAQTWHTTKLALISCALYVPVRSSPRKSAPSARLHALTWV